MEENLHAKKTSWSLPVVSIQYRLVTQPDGRTDRDRDRHTSTANTALAWRRAVKTTTTLETERGRQTEMKTDTGPLVDVAHNRDSWPASWCRRQSVTTCGVLAGCCSCPALCTHSACESSVHSLRATPSYHLFAVTASCYHETGM